MTYFAFLPHHVQEPDARLTVAGCLQSLAVTQAQADSGERKRRPRGAQ